MSWGQIKKSINSDLDTPLNKLIKSDVISTNVPNMQFIGNSSYSAQNDTFNNLQTLVTITSRLRIHYLSISCELLAYGYSNSDKMKVDLNLDGQSFSNIVDCSSNTSSSPTTVQWGISTSNMMLLDNKTPRIFGSSEFYTSSYTSGYQHINPSRIGNGSTIESRGYGNQLLFNYTYTPLITNCLEWKIGFHKYYSGSTEMSIEWCLIYELLD